VVFTKETLERKKRSPISGGYRSTGKGGWKTVTRKRNEESVQPERIVGENEENGTEAGPPPKGKVDAKMVDKVGIEKRSVEPSEKGGRNERGGKRRPRGKKKTDLFADEKKSYAGEKGFLVIF